MNHQAKLLGLAVALLGLIVQSKTHSPLPCSCTFVGEELVVMGKLSFRRACLFMEEPLVGF